MEIIEEFEQRIANYAGSQYGVAVDCCINALFLSFEYLRQLNELKHDETIIVPCRTYHQVPRIIEQMGLKVRYEEIPWKDYYQLKPVRVYDAAVNFKRGMYIEGSLYCVSFNYRKGIPIGKAGMILTDSEKAKKWLDAERFKRYMYMTPEQAARGLSLLIGLQKKSCYLDYEDLSHVQK